MNKLQRILSIFLAAIALSIPANLQAYSFAGGDPVNKFDPDGRCAKGAWAGWTGAGVPGNASQAFMAGYYGGGVASGFDEGWQGGEQIAANTMTFGGTDALGLTDTSQLQGADYTGSRILATIGRESLITAATLGTAQLARTGSEAAYYGYQGLQVVNAGRSGYAMGTGIDQVANGNNWGYVSIVGGGLGVVGGLTMGSTVPELNTLFPAQVQLNRISGLSAEGQAAQDLVAEGNTILGSRVGAQTSDGLRVIDHLVQTPSGQIVAIEVKSGDAIRNAQQVFRDNLMGTEGAVLTGKNAPAGLSGQQIVIPTTVRRYP